MKVKKIVAAFCAGLILTVSIPKSVRSEPISFFWGAIKIAGFFLAVTGLWITMERASLAEHDSAVESLTRHLEDNPEFPINGRCESPDIKSGEAKEGWLVTIDDKKYLHSVVKSEFCEEGGVSQDGKYIIGIFTSQYHAKNFAKVFKYRTNNDIEVYVSSKSFKL